MNDMPEDTNNLRPGGAAAYQSGMEARVAVLEEIARNTAKVLERIEVTIAKIDDRVTKLEDRIAAIDERQNDRMAKMEERLSARMDRIEDRQTNDFRWILALGIGFGGFLWATMAHGFHWF